MISVIIPLYNKEQTIVKTLESVLSQTFQDFEIVIVDDGSSDGSTDVVQSVKDTRIRLFTQQNAGVSAARNRGIEEARGEFIAFLDADDLWKSDYLETQMSLAIKYPQCDVFGTNYTMRNINGTETETIIRKLPFQGQDGILSNYFQVAYFSHPPLFTSAVMVRSDAIRFIGGFPIGIKSGEDLLTWARLATFCNIAYCTSPKVYFSIEGYHVTDLPKRCPSKEDNVGAELRKIKAPYIKQYISLWHKMRSSSYMRLRMRRQSVIEAIKGLYYYPLNYKLYVYVLMNLIPKKLWA